MDRLRVGGDDVFIAHRSNPAEPSRAKRFVGIAARRLYKRPSMGLVRIPERKAGLAYYCLQRTWRHFGTYRLLYYVHVTENKPRRDAAGVFIYLPAWLTS